MQSISLCRFQSWILTMSSRGYLHRAINGIVIAATLIHMAGCISTTRSGFSEVPAGTTYRSPDGSTVVVVQQEAVLVNGRVQYSGFDGIYQNGVKFCGDGKRMGYIAVKNKKFHIIVDGKPFGPFDAIEKKGLAFSPKCKHVVVGIKSGEKWHYWIDGEMGDGYDNISALAPVYSDDDNLLAYGAQKGERWIGVVGKHEIDADKGVNSNPLMPMGFLSTGELYFVSQYFARTYRLHIGDAVGEPFGGVGAGGIVVSPDKGSLAYTVLKGDNWFHCLNLVCRQQTYAYPGTQLFISEGWFGKSFWAHTAMDTVLNIAAAAGGAGVNITTTRFGGPPRKAIYYGSTVFSPNGKHYAYLGYKDATRIYLDDVEVGTVPKSAYVEHLKFNETSDVLVYRASDSSGVTAILVPGTRLSPTPSDENRNQGTLTIKANTPHGLIFLDDQFIGMAPQTIRVSPGTKRVEVQRSGYKTQITTLPVEPNSSRTIEFHLEPVPTRKAVEEVLRANREAAASLPTGDKLLKLRWLVGARYDEEILGALSLNLEEDDAVLFGEQGIYVHNSNSFRSSDPQRYFVPYATFADSPEPIEHQFKEVTLTDDVVANISKGPINSDHIRKLITDLRKALQAIR